MSKDLWQSEIETIDNPFRYSGEYRDDETGNYYLRARYYDPESRRFTSEDYPWKGVTQVPGLVSGSLYAFCENNPVNGIDPSGHLTVVGNTTYYDGDGPNTAYNQACAANSAGISGGSGGSSSSGPSSPAEVKTPAQATDWCQAILAASIKANPLNVFWGDGRGGISNATICAAVAAGVGNEIPQEIINCWGAQFLADAPINDTSVFAVQALEGVQLASAKNRYGIDFTVRTFAVNYSGQIAAGLSGNASVSLVLDLDHKKGSFMVTVGIGGGTPFVGEGFSLTVTNAKTLKDLMGIGYVAGGSAAFVLGAEIVGGSTYTGVTIAPGSKFNFEPGVEVHGMGTYTWSTRSLTADELCFLVDLYGKLSPSLLGGNPLDIGLLDIDLEM